MHSPKGLLTNTPFTGVTASGGTKEGVSRGQIFCLPVASHSAEVTCQIHIYVNFLFLFIVLHLPFCFRKCTRLNFLTRDLINSHNFRGFAPWILNRLFPWTSPDVVTFNVLNWEEESNWKKKKHLESLHSVMHFKPKYILFIRLKNSMLKSQSFQGLFTPTSRGALPIVPTWGPKLASCQLRRIAVLIKIIWNHCLHWMYFESKCTCPEIKLSSQRCVKTS